jgi:CelD/BcsL family acetyltransferase involved in cellulose biosynthesis
METAGKQLGRAGAVNVDVPELSARGRRPTTLNVRRFESVVPTEIWDALEQKLPPAQRFLAYRWFQSWFTTQIPANRWRGPPYYYVAFDGTGNPVGIVPFAHQRYGPFRLPTVAGYYFPFRGPLFAENLESEIASALATTMRSSIPFAFRVGPTCRGHRSIEALVSALRADGWTLIQMERGTEYVVDLPTTIERFRADNMSANLRSSTGRKYRRMLRQDGTRLERYSALTTEAWKTVIEDMADVEHRSWVGQESGFLHFRNSANAAFWLACLEEQRMSAATHAAVVYVNDRPMAFEFWFDSGDTRYFVAGLHDAAVAEHSPGFFLMQLMLEDAIERGLKRANLGQGDAGYKSRFGALPGELIDDWVAIRPGVGGRAIEALWNTKKALTHRISRLSRPATDGGRSSVEQRLSLTARIQH